MSTTTTTELIHSAPSEESDLNMLQLPRQNNQPAQVQIRAYHSADIKSPLGRLRNQVSSLEAEEYLTHTRLLAAAAQIEVNNAAGNAIQQRFREYRLLLDIGKNGRDTTQLDLGTALTLARLARETLASERNLALSKLNACHKELVVLQDAADETLVFLTDADHQIAQILNIFANGRVAIPKDHDGPLFFSSPNPTFERPNHLFSFPMEEDSDEEEEEEEKSSTSHSHSDRAS